MKAQVQGLILDPLYDSHTTPSLLYFLPFGGYQRASASNEAKVIVIDGAEEVLSPLAFSELVLALEPLILNRDHRLLFLISSSSETQSQILSNRPPLNTTVSLDLSDPELSKADMAAYLHSEFKAIKLSTPRLRGVSNWPSSTTIPILVERFNGNFEDASKFMNILKDPFWQDPAAILSRMMSGPAAYIYRQEVFPILNLASATRRRWMKFFVLFCMSQIPDKGSKDFLTLSGFYNDLTWR